MRSKGERGDGVEMVKGGFAPTQRCHGSEQRAQYEVPKSSFNVYILEKARRRRSSPKFFRHHRG